MLNKFLNRAIVHIMIMRGHYDVNCMQKNAKKAQTVNDNLLMKIISQNKDSEYGRRYHFADIKSPADFKKMVPIVQYKDIENEVHRIYCNNEQNVLTSKPVIGFATSSGSIGAPKIIPRTDDDIGIYTKYTVTRFLALGKEYAKDHGLKFAPARGICTLSQYKETSPFGLSSTNVADIAAKKYYSIYPHLLVLPLGYQFAADDIDLLYGYIRFGLEEKDCLFIFSVFAKTMFEVFEYIQTNWQMLVKDIEQGTIDSSITIKPEIRKDLKKIVKPNPERAKELRSEFEKGFDETIVKRIWPNLSVMSAIGTSKSFDGFVESIRKYTAGIPFDYSIYGASEGLMAAAYESDKKGQLMLPDSCYYEFVEADDEDDAKDITETLPVSQLEVGKKYEVILTNQSGFYRYRINDVIEVLDYVGQCPVINFVYRRGQLLNITGEKTNMEQMSEAIARLQKESGIQIQEWTVYADRGEKHYRYTLLVDARDGQKLKAYETSFEQHLRDVNTSYNYYEKIEDLIDPPVIRTVKPGSFAEWVEYKVSIGATRENIKPVRMLDTDEKMEFFIKRIQ